MLHFEMIFLRVMHFTHKTLCTKFLHWVGWSRVTPDDPTKQWISALSKSGWSGLNPDDPDLEICERLVVLGRMIRPYTRWSGPGKFKRVFSLFCHYPGWSEVTPDDPETTKKHTTVTFGGGSIYTPSPPSFTPLSLPDQPRLPSLHSLISLHPRAWFLQGNT